jgi:hypothetical protein
MSVLYLHSVWGAPPPRLGAAAARGEVTILPQADFAPEHLRSFSGLITDNQLDQDTLLEMKDSLAAFLARGGRWFFNGHMVRPLVAGIGPYQPIRQPKRADFDLRCLNPHPLFDGIDLKQLETNKGVAGFYGRGCNPLPQGAVAINGLGAAGVPVDWVWALPGGGRFFSHSGNDLGALGVEWGLPGELTDRIIRWAAGGPCLEVGASDWQRPEPDLPLMPAEPYAPRRRAREKDRRMVAPSCGAYYHTHSLLGARYGEAFDVVCRPEELGKLLRPTDILWVPCRSPAGRLIAQKAVIERHLAAGGTVVATGESNSELWLPAIRFTPTPTNWWWWLEPGADLGVEITAPGHPLMAGMGKEDVTWHLHGWFAPPAGAEVLVRDGEGQAVLYVDEVSTPGRLIVTSLDPMFHHGSHFMPATTLFLDRFIPNLKAWLDV